MLDVDVEWAFGRVWVRVEGSWGPWVTWWAEQWWALILHPDDIGSLVVYPLELLLGDQHNLKRYQVAPKRSKITQTCSKIAPSGSKIDQTCFKNVTRNQLPKQNDQTSMTTRPRGTKNCPEASSDPRLEAQDRRPRLKINLSITQSLNHSFIQS